MTSLRQLRWALLAACAASSGVAADESRPPGAPSRAPADPPVVALGLPLADGTWIGPHLPLVAPPRSEGTRWVVARAGTRTFQGRRVDVYRYVPADGKDATPYYAQSDFVDPTTGEVVGGVVGSETGSVEDAGAAAACAPR